MTLIIYMKSGNKKSKIERVALHSVALDQIEAITEIR